MAMSEKTMDILYDGIPLIIHYSGSTAEDIEIIAVCVKNTDADIYDFVTPGTIDALMDRVISGDEIARQEHNYEMRMNDRHNSEEAK